MADFDSQSLTAGRIGAVTKHKKYRRVVSAAPDVVASCYSLDDYVVLDEARLVFVKTLNQALYTLLAISLLCTKVSLLVCVHTCLPIIAKSC